MKKILFLDIDGVLNSFRTALVMGGYGFMQENEYKLDPISVEMVKYLQNNGVEIVLSSTWRIGATREDLGNFYIETGIDIERCTKVMAGIRGEEIQEFLESEDEDVMYCILDDDSDMLPEQMDNFVLVNGQDGYSWQNHVKVCEILEVPLFKGNE